MLDLFDSDISADRKDAEINIIRRIKKAVFFAMTRGLLEFSNNGLFNL